VNATNGTFGSQTNVDAIDTLATNDGKLYIGTEEANAGSVYSFNKSLGVSNDLRFYSGYLKGSPVFTNNYGSISFIGSEQSAGNTGSTGTFLFSNGITSSAGGYDVAEDYPTRDDTLVAGDIVSIDPSEETFVQRANATNASLITGVYSTNPALHLSQKDATINGARAVPVALAGRVPVKVSAENGPIAAGDAITISPTHPGVGVKAIGSGRIVGMSMGAYDGTDIGTVTVFINPSYFNPSATNALQADKLNITGDTALQGSVQVAGDINVGGNVKVAGDLTVTGKATIATLDVTGDTTVQKLTVNGHIVTGGNTPTVQPGAGAGTADVINHIDAPSVQVEGNDTSGTVTIVAGAQPQAGEVATAFSTKPRVVFTPANRESTKVGAYYDRSGISATGFSIFTDGAMEPGKTYIFSYFVTQ
jgi:hypothetical protein